MGNSNKNFADTTISSLKKATAEFEELQLQISLGKAEAKDKYKEFSNKVGEII